MDCKSFRIRIPTSRWCNVLYWWQEYMYMGLPVFRYFLYYHLSCMKRLNAQKRLFYLHHTCPERPFQLRSPVRIVCSFGGLHNRIFQLDFLFRQTDHSSDLWDLRHWRRIHDAPSPLGIFYHYWFLRRLLEGLRVWMWSPVGGWGRTLVAHRRPWSTAGRWCRRPPSYHQIHTGREKEYHGQVTTVTTMMMMMIILIIQGSTFPGAQGHMPLDFAVGP